ncbi:transcriptional regulator [Acinetobacter celticus]|nr:transcriptional regulator [Acinetobacter celticus]
MQLLSIGKDKFYNLVNYEDIQQPMSISEKTVFWYSYSSYVKNKVEEHKLESDIVAHT